MEQYEQISSVGTHLYIQDNTSCVYIMYVFNVPIQVNKLILTFLLFIKS